MSIQTQILEKVYKNGYLSREDSFSIGNHYPATIDRRARELKDLIIKVRDGLTENSIIIGYKPNPKYKKKFKKLYDLL